MKRGALLCAALALLSAVYAFKAAPRMPDFEVYWRAGVRAAHAQPLYNPADGHYQLKYLPAFAVLAVPIAWAPLPVAKAIWFALSVVMLCAFVWASIALLPGRRMRLWVIALCVGLAMAKFYGHELVLGQVNLLLGALITAAVHLVNRNRAVASGLLFALAIIVKPYAVIFLPWLAATRNIGALAVAAFSTIGAIILPALVYGFDETWTLHVEWWHTVSASTAPNLLNADNVSLAAMFAKWLGRGQAAQALTVVAGGVLALVAADVVRRRENRPDSAGLEAALLLTLIPLLSPQGWDYVFLLATPAIVFFVNYADRLPLALRSATAVALATAAFSLFDVMGRRAYGTFMALSIITICFLVVIGALYALRVRRIA